MELKTIIEDRPQCRRCGSLDVIATGQRFNKTKRAMVQDYMCRKCSSHFTAGSWMKFGAPKETIEYCISLFKRGFDSDEVIGKVERQSGVKYSRHTMLNWVHRFAPEVELKRGWGSGPKRLAQTIRKEVPLEVLAKGTHLSPSKVEGLLMNMEQFTKSPLTLKMKRELRAAKSMQRDLRSMQKKLDRIVRLLEKEKLPTRDKNRNIGGGPRRASG